MRGASSSSGGGYSSDTIFVSLRTDPQRGPVAESSWSSGSRTYGDTSENRAGGSRRAENARESKRFADAQEANRKAEREYNEKNAQIKIQEEIQKTSQQSIDKGEELINEDDFETALVYFNNAIKTYPKNAKWIERRAEINLHRKDFKGAIDDWNRAHQIKGITANAVWGLEHGAIYDTVIDTFLLVNDVSTLACNTGFFGVVGGCVEKFCKIMDTEYAKNHPKLVDEAAWNLAVRTITAPIAAFLSISTDIVELSAKWSSLNEEEKAFEAARCLGKNLVSPIISTKVTKNGKATLKNLLSQE